MTNRVALIQAKPSRTNFQDQFGIQLDVYRLTSETGVSRILKKHIDIQINIQQYDWIILVGADPFKYFTKNSSITTYSGKIVDQKFLPTINPAMTKFKPQVLPLWQQSKSNILKYISGQKKQLNYSDQNIKGIKQTAQALQFLKAARDSQSKYVAMDCETSGLYCRNCYVLGISLSYKKDHGSYIDAQCLDQQCVDVIQEILDTKTIVFHNAKFDIPMLQYHFGITFKQFQDTMLLHYALNQVPGTHGLKQLALKYTDYGDYQKQMYIWMQQQKRRLGLTKDTFTWDLIPFDIMKVYASIDPIVTLLLFIKFKAAVNRNNRLKKLYQTILLPACRFLIQVQQTGVPFDKEVLLFGQKQMQRQIQQATDLLYTYPQVKAFQQEQGKQFNPNSTVQLRKLLFDKIGLSPTGKRTGTQQHSTDSQVLGILAQYHQIPSLISTIRKKRKIKNTYLDKIIPSIDRDGRLRTNFNLHGTTSGRLSSSGKLNVQQLPRDASVVKGSIRARQGYKIVSMDLQTGQVYIAAVLSKDKNLQQIFLDGGDFHSTIAKKVFKLPCSVQEVKKLYPLYRQAAKAITFGIMYQAGPHKISQQVTKDAKTLKMDIVFTVQQAKDAINQYFKQFKQLKAWIQKNKKEIISKGYIYSHFNRKRRLANVFSQDRAIAGHTVRSGINFLIQSPCSDVNLISAIQAHKVIKQRKLDANMFMLVHDSIVAQVRQDQIQQYCSIVTKHMAVDRGLSIPNKPIGIDFQIGDDYSFGKFQKQYGDVFQRVQA